MALITTGKLLSQRLEDLAQVTLANVVLPSIREEVRDRIVVNILESLEDAAREQGKTTISFKIENPGMFEHRVLVVEECLKILPIDIDCKIVATDEMEMAFLLRFSTVEPFKGGEANYDYPVFVINEDEFSWSHNLVHLKTLELEGAAVVLREAFEIILGYCGGLSSMARVIEWGLANPQIIVDVADRPGFFTQFHVEGATIMTEPFMGGA